ncbi:MAG: hypothetical protein ACI83P_000851 [Janthinobacterium sp.]|jgi:hypothetical protein
MKRSRRLCVLSGFSYALLLGACAQWPGPVPGPEPEPRPDASVGASAAGQGGAIERVPFVLGVSSATVERMALRAACNGGSGAGLMTPPGPVEVYRMACANGKVFMARCELRQCKPM